MNGRGERIKAERKRLNWRQEDLARRAKVSRGIIGDLERGRNHGTTKILDVAKALKVNPIWLETGKGPREPVPESNVPYLTANSLEDLAEVLLARGAEEIGQLMALIVKKQAERK